MSSGDWKRVRVVFDAALRRDPEERQAFLDQACADSPWLRSQVASLLDAHDGEPVKTRVFGPPVDLPADDSAGSFGRVIGPYIIRHEIGRGGMGVVYLADDVRLSRRVALKTLSPGINRDAGFRERMRQEARAAAALSHPGIATVYAFEEFDNEMYLACEYVPGQTLRAVLESGPLPLADVVDVAGQLAAALAAAHAQGVVHRDLKPENVVRTPAGVVKVLDFGVARVDSLTPAHLTQTGTLLGTPAYMAPEQARGQHVDFRADLFSFGVLIYEMASGSNPFEAATFAATMARVLEIDPVALSEGCAEGSPTLDRIIATCLRKEPAERYKSTAALVADLERLQPQESTDRDPVASGRRPDVAGPLPGQRSRTPRWWWEFHQIAVSTLYVMMLYPAWRVRSWLPPPWGMLFLFAVLASAAAATSVRLHLWFTARFYPAELSAQRARALLWTRCSDAGFAGFVLLGALAIGNAHPEIATLLLTVSVAAAVASSIIEPATARAAFKGRKSAVRTPSKQRRSPSP